MSEKHFAGGSMLVGDDFKPGDPAPAGYLDWHEWAAIQHKAGPRQKACGRCGKWKFPQELTDQTVSYTALTALGQKVRHVKPLCNECAISPQAQPKGTT